MMQVGIVLRYLHFSCDARTPNNAELRSKPTPTNAKNTSVREILANYWP
jgi:hypothetical protein